MGAITRLKNVLASARSETQVYLADGRRAMSNAAAAYIISDDKWLISLLIATASLEMGWQCLCPSTKDTQSYLAELIREWHRQSLLAFTAGGAAVCSVAPVVPTNGAAAISARVTSSSKSQLHRVSRALSSAAASVPAGSVSSSDSAHLPSFGSSNRTSAALSGLQQHGNDDDADDDDVIIL
jgi:hypothetical protein